MVPFRHGVSIHALLAECDRVRNWPARLVSQFQSTHSLRSATPHSTWEIVLHRVSIHALLAECDKTKTKRKEIKQCFNPRTPCGVRHEHEIHEHVSIQFQSTHSLRSAT